MAAAAAPGTTASTSATNVVVRDVIPLAPLDHQSDLCGEILQTALSDAVSGLFAIDTLLSNPLLTLRPTSVPSNVCQIPMRWKADLPIDATDALDFDRADDDVDHSNFFLSSPRQSEVGLDDPFASDREHLQPSYRFHQPLSPRREPLPISRRTQPSSTMSSELKKHFGSVSPRPSPAVGLPSPAATQGSGIPDMEAAPISSTLNSKSSSGALIFRGTNPPADHETTFGLQFLQAALSRLQLPEAPGLQAQRVALLGSKSESIASLQAEKRVVKEELKLYDSSFKKAFSCLPNKKQKEPMRPLYAYYKKVRTALLHKEQRYPSSEADSELPAKSSKITGAGTGTVGGNLQSSLCSAPRKQGSGSSAETTAVVAPSPLSAAEVGANELAEDLRRLQRLEEQKHQIALRLQQYQQYFLRTYGRKIVYHKDIVPVENDYRRYKQLRELVNKLVESIRKRQKHDDRALYSGKTHTTSGAPVGNSESSRDLSASAPPAMELGI